MESNQKLRPGLRLYSAVSPAEIVVVAVGGEATAITCGGQPMLDAPGGTDADASAGPAMGKRYWDEQSGVEVLCTKPGGGELAIDGRTMVERSTKSLPSSD